MKTSIAFFLLFVLCIITSAQKIDGNWKSSISTPNGEFELTYTFKVVADSLIGSITSPMGTREIENGKVKGNSFSFDTNFNGRIMTNTGVVEGDTIKLSSARRPEPRILTRIKEEIKSEQK